jgi:hypothetical protein
MSKKRNSYIGPIAVGYLPKATISQLDGQVNARLWTPLHDDATYHWVPQVACSSPTLTTLARYDDGNTGSFVLDTSSDAEIVLFEADFKDEIEILKSHFEKVEVIFGVISY